MSCAVKPEPAQPPPLWKRALAKIWAFDTETFLTQPGLPAPDIVCGSWADEEGEWIGDPNETRAFFVGALERGDHLVGINLAFDIVVMAARWPELLPLIFKAGNAGQFHDCSIREALNDIALGTLKDKSDDELDWNRYGMEVLMLRHFNIDISAEKKGDVYRYKYGKLAPIPMSQWPQEAIDYPKADARRTYDICRKQAGSKAHGWKRYQNLHDEPAQVRASIAIQLMVCWGLRTDGVYLGYLESQVDLAWNEARTELAKANIFEPTREGEWKKNTKVLQLLVSKAYGGKPPTTSPSSRFPNGQICTDRDTLEESGDPTLLKLATTGKNDKRKTVYLPALRKGTDRPITPKFNVLVATGRVSSDWQQMPQKGGIREGVLSRGYLKFLAQRDPVLRRLVESAGFDVDSLPDTVISSLDFGGLELRTMSQRAINDPDVKYSKMANFINAGKDVHCYVGAYFLDVSYEEFVRRYEGKDPLCEAFRKFAKIFNFGKGGGMGAGALAYNARTKDGIRFCLLSGRSTKCGVDKQKVMVQGKWKQVCAVCVKIASELGEKWLKAWPEQGLLFQKASRLTKKGRKAESLTFGSNRVRGECTYSKWLNNPFQGAGADGVKAAMWAIAEESYTNRFSPLWGSHVFLNVHDELLIEHPWERRHEASHRAAQIMVETMDRITPDAKNEVEPAIMRRLFKAASKTVGKDGLIKPWWPTDKKCDAANDNHHSDKCGCWRWAPDRETMLADLAA